MNLTQTQVDAWIQANQVHHWSAPNTETRVYPSAIFIKDFKLAPWLVGAQNVYYQKSGAFTGELSIEQLQSIGAHSVLIGHSERRDLFKEDNALITQKVAACAQAAFPFILCCGEPLSVRKAQTHEAYVIEQLQNNLQNLSVDQIDLLVIAYEPIWAIGTGLSATEQEITQMHLLIRNLLTDLYGQVGHTVPILYGGSVNAANAAQIFACPDVDGALVGGAALDPASFYQLWQALIG